MTQFADVNGVRLPFPDDATPDEIQASVKAFVAQQGGGGGQQPPQPKFDPYEGGIYSIPGLGPLLQKFSRGTDNFQRGVADTATLGFSDEASAALNHPISAYHSLVGDDTGGEAYDSTLKDERQKLADSGTMGTLGQLTGALMMPGKGIPAAIGEGAAYGFGSGEDGWDKRLIGGGVGGVLGGAGGLLGMLGGKVFGKVADKFGGKAADDVIRTSEDAFSSGSRLYKAAEDEGVNFGADAVAKLGDDLKTAAGRLNTSLRPKTAGFVDDLGDELSGDLSLESFDELRKRIGKEIGKPGTSAEDARTLGKMKDVLDKFGDNVQPGDFTGDATKAVGILKDARGEWARGSKLETLEQLIDRADVRDNNTAQRNLARSLYDKIVAGTDNRWTKEEEAMIRDVAKGRSNALLDTAKQLKPKGIVSIAGGQFLGSMFPGGHVIVPMVGGVADELAQHVSANKVGKLQQLVSGGGGGLVKDLPILPAFADALRSRAVRTPALPLAATIPGYRALVSDTALEPRAAKARRSQQ